MASCHWEHLECLKVAVLAACWIEYWNEWRQLCSLRPEGLYVEELWSCHRFGMGLRQFGYLKVVWRLQTGPKNLYLSGKRVLP